MKEFYEISVVLQALRHIRRLVGVIPELHETIRFIFDKLAKTEGNREKTAKILGIGERTLYRKIKEYHL